ncbi:MAG: hypothetical protein JNK05_13210 [Myxococcales bacterium]|nr:hypothetical protein [Myxococcales bacterium]
MPKKNDPLDAILTKAMIDDLTDERDEAAALRKALLFCLIQLARTPSQELPPFGAWLVTSLPALRDAFVQNKHPLCGEIETLLARTHRGGITLMLPLAPLEALLAKMTAV